MCWRLLLRGPTSACSSRPLCAAATRAQPFDHRGFSPTAVLPSSSASEYRRSAVSAAARLLKKTSFVGSSAMHFENAAAASSYLCQQSGSECPQPSPSRLSSCSVRASWQRMQPFPSPSGRQPRPWLPRPPAQDTAGPARGSPRQRTAAPPAQRTGLSKAGSASSNRAAAHRSVFAPCRPPRRCHCCPWAASWQAQAHHRSCCPAGERGTAGTLEHVAHMSDCCLVCLHLQAHACIDRASVRRPRRAALAELAAPASPPPDKPPPLRPAPRPSA